MIKAQHLEKYFDFDFDFDKGAERLSVLQSVSLEIRSSESVSVIGPSGSGKSTLLALLSGLDRPDRGQIVVGGTQLETLSEQALSVFRATQVGIVFQQFHLMPHLSALENVCLPLEIANHLPDRFHPNRVQKSLTVMMASAEQMLAEVGLEHRLHHLPAELSGGECQRVAIARALVTQPSYLFADEPSGNLDAKTGDQVMTLLFDLVKQFQTTLVLVTHDQTLAHACDRTLQLQDGHLKESML